MSLLKNHQEIRTIVDYHNELRNGVYAGNTHLPPASASVSNLVWDDDLAAGAQAYVKHILYTM